MLQIPFEQTSGEIIRRQIESDSANLVASSEYINEPYAVGKIVESGYFVALVVLPHCYINGDQDTFSCIILDALDDDDKDRIGSIEFFGKAWFSNSSKTVNYYKQVFDNSKDLILHMNKNFCFDCGTPHTGIA